jgi:DNA repair protein RadC
MRRIKVSFVNEKSPNYNSENRIQNQEDCIFIFLKSFPPESAFQEHLFLLPLNSANIPCCAPILIGKGALDSAPADPKVIFRYLLNIPECGGFIIAHNHPSGDFKDSEADRLFTNQISKASEIMGFRFLDHLLLDTNRRIGTSIKPR